jgi:hypothetical protein
VLDDLTDAEHGWARRLLGHGRSRILEGFRKYAEMLETLTQQGFLVLNETGRDSRSVIRIPLGLNLKTSLRRGFLFDGLEST